MKGEDGKVNGLQKYEDWRANEIKVGCSIIYPVVKSSSHIEIVEAYVEEIIPIEYKTNWGHERRTFKLKVRPYGRLSAGNPKWKVEKNYEILTAVERVTVIS